MRPSKPWALVQAWFFTVCPGVAASRQPILDEPHWHGNTTSSDANLSPGPLLNSTQPFSTEPAIPHATIVGPAEEPESIDQGISTAEIPAPPPIMGWLGSIGGILGIISFADTYIERIIKAIQKAKEKRLDKGDPSWTVAIQVGLDASGLEGAGGDFPQICLWNAAGQLMGWADQRLFLQTGKKHGIKKIKKKNKKEADKHQRHRGYTLPRPEGMPYIENGGIAAAGVWPAPGKESMKASQAAYVTMIKRHFDAVCVASVHVEWPDKTKWTFDGSWGRASNMSWYLSHVYDSEGHQRECFWLDHKGNLDTQKDKKDEYIVKDIKHIGGIPKKDFPEWLWAHDVIEPNGVPSGPDLTEGMKMNGVDQGRTPLGVTFFLPAFKAMSYKNLTNLGIDDFTRNMGKIKWIGDWLKQGDNPVIPIMHPDDDYTDPNARLIYEDQWKEDIPADCLTDWYYDRDGKLINPGDGRRCLYEPKGHGLSVHHRIHHCHEGTKRGLDDSNSPPVPLRKRFSRTLVMDKIARGGIGTKSLCEDPHSVGPSYANRLERQFCRMTDKTLWPFCDRSEGLSSDCFEEETETLVEEHMPLARRSTHWDLVEHWHKHGRLQWAVGDDDQLMPVIKAAA